MTLQNSPDFVVLDASALVALCAQEPDRYDVVRTEVERYARGGAVFYAPSVVVSEVMFVFCRKTADGQLTESEHEKAVQSLHAQMGAIEPSPSGEADLISRAEAVRAGYGCSRCADGLYIALAELLAQRGTAVLLTFDRDLPNQVSRNAPTVHVHLLS